MQIDSHTKVQGGSRKGIETPAFVLPASPLLVRLVIPKQGANKREDVRARRGVA